MTIKGHSRVKCTVTCFIKKNKNYLKYIDKQFTKLKICIRLNASVNYTFLI